MSPHSVKYFRKQKRGPEAAIERVVVDNLGNLFPASTSHKLWTAGSATVGAGMPDLTVVSCRPRTFSFARIYIPDAELLAYLRAVNRASIKKMANRTRNSEAQLRKNLQRLVRARAINNRCDVFSMNHRWREILPEITTIEVKVADWKRAIGQAARNRIFAHRSFIALPLRVALRVQAEPILAHLGLGLMGITEDRQVLVLRKARRHKPKVWTYYYQIAVLSSRYCKV